MIQRIQSVYLLLVTILMVITAFTSLFTFRGDSDIYLFTTNTGWSLLNTEFRLQEGFFVSAIRIYGIPFIASLTALLSLINIFLYKKRRLQIRIGYTTMCCLALLNVMIAVYFYYLLQNLDSLEYISIKYGIVLPIIALIINVLAILGIRKDDKLIKSLDRIR